MRFLVWCGCVTICLSGLQLSFFAHDGWRWFWFPALGFYTLAGAILGILSLAKLVSGKVGVGRPGRPSVVQRGAANPDKEE